MKILTNQRWGEVLSAFNKIPETITFNRKLEIGDSDEKTKIRGNTISFLSVDKEEKHNMIAVGTAHPIRPEHMMIFFKNCSMFTVGDTCMEVDEVENRIRMTFYFDVQGMDIIK